MRKSNYLELNLGFLLQDRVVMIAAHFDQFQQLLDVLGVPAQLIEERTRPVREPFGKVSHIVISRTYQMVESIAWACKWAPGWTHLERPDLEGGAPNDLCAH